MNGLKTNMKTGKLCDRDVQSLNRLAQLNFNTEQSLYKRGKSLGKFFLQLLKSNFDDFLQITGN